ncbi:MAG: ribonuclease P protein component [Bosea sp. (in: a-proteobacteria)]
MGLQHIKIRRDFKAAAANGRRFRTSAFTAQIVSQEMPAEQGLRLGLTASRHTGTSTERNRIRRRLRAAAETAGRNQSDAPLDVVLVARREALSTPFATLTHDIAKAIDKAVRAAAQAHSSKSV